MRTRPFGWTREPVSIIGQGTWNLEQGSRSQAVTAIRAGLDAGMNHIDTAEMYGSGAVETLVGEAIAGRRDEVFLVTKVLPTNASRQGTLAACSRSLKRLGTDRIDLYLLHWPGAHPLEETISAFEELRHKGMIRFWGLSNFDAHELDRALAIAGPHKIATNQVLYHLQERAIEHAIFPWCERHNVALQAYSPFGSGDFPSDESVGGRLLNAVALAHGATPRQVALAFLVRESRVFAIPKASSAQHATENAAAAGIALSEDELGQIERAFPRGRPPRRLPTL